MLIAPRTLLAAAAAVTAAQVALAAPGHATPTARDAGQNAAASPGVAVAPYEYLDWGNPQAPASVLSATGVKWLTLAFVLSDGGCNPKWDGSRSLTGSDKTAINSIRSAGGDVVVSFGGWSGNKLGEHCSSASALAGAYQKVIDAYGLKAIDIDIESTEFSNGTVQQRVIDALKIVKSKNSGIKTYITFGTTPSGPDSTGKALINRGAKAGLDNDGWTIMPFDFGSHSGSMGSVSTKAADGLKNAVKSASGYSDSVAYSHIGISSMNGESDETVTTGDFQTILSYAKSHHIARLTFWAVNRDRKCGSGESAGDSCSGVSQSAYAYSKIFAQYTG